MTRIGIIIGSTRPGRIGKAVGEWVFGIANERKDAEYELLDINSFDLPLYDEPVPPAMSADYQHEHTRRWAAAIAPLDGFVFVTAEYNHGIPGALKNALDFLYGEWNNKAAGFVSYGSAGGARAVESLRLVAAELQVATVRAQVMLSLADDFEHYSEFAPRPMHEQGVAGVLDQLVPWTKAMEQVRAGEAGLRLAG